MTDHALPPIEGQTLESKLNHLYARTEAQTYRIGKNTDSVERMEKTLEKLADTLSTLTAALSQYNLQLAVHMARTEALEKIVAEMERKREAWLPRALQAVSLVAGLVALLKLAI